MHIERLVVHNYKLFRGLDVGLRPGVSIVVGDNEAGKSTLLEALTLGLTGRLHGRWAREHLTANWFNRDAVAEYFAARDGISPSELPTIEIELYLADPEGVLQDHRGVHNSRNEDAIGMRLLVEPSAEFADELEAYLNEDGPAILPIEYYGVRWCDFADQQLWRRPKGLGHVLVDARTIRSTAGVDYHTRQLVEDFLEPGERAAISIAQRSSDHYITSDLLDDANERLAGRDDPLLAGRDLRLAVDEASSTRWASGVVPVIDGAPFALAGQGLQAMVKIALAVDQTADSDAFVFIEEPENHLSHTTLTRLLATIATLGEGRQTVVTTHNSYVLNRLGLDRLLLLKDSKPARFDDLPTDTVSYFKRLSGYDTLRLVLADRVVLVEGPSDDLVFTRLYTDATGRSPAADGIDVISMHGLALKRGIQLAAALDRQAFALRDNDGYDADHWAAPLAEWLSNDTRRLFVGDVEAGDTLEPQLCHVNDSRALREVLGLDVEDDPCEWMSENKTEAALRIAESDIELARPSYIQDAIDALT